MVDIRTAVARLYRHDLSTAGNTAPQWTFGPVASLDGQVLSAHCFDRELVVVYAVDGPDGPQFVTESMRAAAGFSDVDLRSVGLTNLANVAATVKFRRSGRRLMLSGNRFAASFLLLEQFWDRPEVAALFPNGPVATIGASDVIVVCDRNDGEEIANLRRSAELVWMTGPASTEHLASELYERWENGEWHVLGTKRNASTGADVVSAVGTADARVEPDVAHDIEPALPIETDVNPEQPEPELEQPEPETVAPRPAVSPARALARRLERERSMALWIITGLTATVALLNGVVRHADSMLQLGVYGAAAVVFGLNAMSRSDEAKHNPEIDDPETTPEPTNRLVLAGYAIAASMATIGAVGTWHGFDDVRFNGLQRGGGVYVLVFAAILGFGVVLGEQWDGLRRPWDSALHAVALACGTAFVIVSFTGVAGGGMSGARRLVLVAGFATIVISVALLRSAHPDRLSLRTIRAGLLAAGGFAMMTLPFTSWGGGTFLVNYVPGTQIGGLDGRVTVAAGVATVGACGSWFFSDRANPAHWVYLIRTTAVLSLVGLFGVMSRGLSVPHVGRTATAVACGVVLLLAAGGDQEAVARKHDENRWWPLVQRVSLGSFVLLGAALFVIGTQRLGLPVIYVGPWANQDSLLFAALFVMLGLTLFRVVFEALRGNALAGSVGGILLSGLAALMLIPPGATSSAGLISGAIFLALGLLGLFSTRWMSGIAESAPTLATVRQTLRGDWRRAAVGAIVAWAFMRWGFGRVFSFDGAPSGSITDAEYESIVRARSLLQTLRIVVPWMFLSLVMARRNVASTVLFSLVCGLLCFEFVLGALARTGELGEYQFEVQAAVLAVGSGFFMLGRGRFSVVAIMFATSFASVLAIAFSFHRFVMGRVLEWMAISVPTVIDRELPGLTSALTYFIVALTFAAFPVDAARPGANGDKPQAGAAANDSALVPNPSFIGASHGGGA